jgi:hypothetical protein
VSRLDRRLPSFRMAARGLLFLVRMWASEWRFRRHARCRAEHERQAARFEQLMAAEVEFRVRLCTRRERGKPGWQPSRTASGVPAVPRIPMQGSGRCIA